MKKIAIGNRVGPVIVETGDDGKQRTLPPRYFGVVVEAAEDGQTGYVKMDGEGPSPERKGFGQMDPVRGVFVAHGSGRRFFHASELEPEPKK